jgi:hypothetical protein
VRVVDLAFIVPISLATAYGLWRGNATAIKAAYGVTAFLVLQATAVLAMGVIMVLCQDPSATPTLIVAFAPISIGLSVLTAILYAWSQQAERSPLSRPLSLSAIRTPANANCRGNRCDDGYLAARGGSGHLEFGAPRASTPKSATWRRSKLSAECRTEYMIIVRCSLRPPHISIPSALSLAHHYHM